MKRQLVAIALSLTLLTALTTPAAGLSVHAEEEQNKTPEESEDDKEKDETPEESEDDKEKDEDKEIDVQSEDQGDGKTVKDTGTDKDVDEDDNEDDDIDISEILDGITYSIYDIPTSYIDDGSYEETPAEEVWANGISLTTPSCIIGDRLSGYARSTYDAILPQIAEVAQGQCISTQFSYHLTDEEWAELVRDAADETKFVQKLTMLLYAMYYDYGCGFYWWDGIIRINTDDPNHTLLFPLAVTPAYQTTDQTYWSDGICHGVDTDGSAMQTAQKAFDNATIIAHEADGMEAYDALQYFHDRICDLVIYDNEAFEKIADPTSISDRGPWNLIYAFDMDPNTNIVCEGYAKAFRYLFDEWMTVPENKNKMGDAYCITTTGMMGGNDSADVAGDILHMWNTLVTKNGKYHIDVTNDDKRSAGYPYSLFLKRPTKFYNLSVDGEERTWRYYFETPLAPKGITQYAYAQASGGKLSYPQFDYYTNEQIGDTTANPFKTW